MGGCKFQTQNTRNRCRILYANGILILALVFGSAAGRHSLETDGESTVPDCSRSLACKYCTQDSLCSWSLETQSCFHSMNITGNLIVHIDDNCPLLFATVDQLRNTVSMSEAYTFQVNVFNDLHGFMTFLGRTRLTCWLDGSPSYGTLVDNTIVCDTVPVLSESGRPRNKPRVVFNYVTFDGTVLRMDHVANNYLLLDEYCPGVGRSYCVSCSWNEPGVTHFYARCAANNTCSGPFEFYEQRKASDYTVMSVRGDVDTRLQCSELAVLDVTPSSARWNRGTTVRITVGGHAIMADQRDVTVTVAGRTCTAPSTVDERTLACTVPLATQPGPSNGPVIVRYGRHDVVVSTQRFRFEYPEVRTVSPVCGPLKGGTRLRIGGRSLNTSTVVRVTVGPAALECHTVDLDDQSIHCETAPSAVATSGPVMVLFDKSLTEHVVSSTFAYTDDVPAVDDGQRYRIYRTLVGGHSEVKVHGRHLSCIETAEIYYVHGHSVRYAGCAVMDDTHMVCQAPGPGQWLVPNPDHFGFRVMAAGSVWDINPGPDPSDYFSFATPTTLKVVTLKVVAVFALFGCLALCYACTKKRSPDTVAACNLVVEFKKPAVDPTPAYNNLM